MPNLLKYITDARRAAVAVFLLAVVVVGGFEGGKAWLAKRDADNRAPVHLTVNDSTKAESARLSVQKDSLKALIDAAKTLHGDLVAGVKIVVKSETVFVAVKNVPTVNHADSSRTAKLVDTTKTGYIITVDAEAPAYPAPLELGYTFVTPEFHPEVGFVKRADGFYATVSWAGAHFEVKNAFFKPEKERPLAVIAGADLVGSPVAALAGVSLSGRVYGGVQYNTPKRLSIELLAGNQNGSPFVGLGVRKRIW